MGITTVLFDLDGTLLPMDQDVFVKAYFKGLAARLMPLGYEPQQLVQSIWAGTAAMVKNDGGCVNEQAFWKTFCGIYGEEAMKDYPVFEAFYAEDFDRVKVSCGFNAAADATVKRLKAKGLRVALATNPIFPAIATEKRMKWAGLDKNDFELYTTYENACRCKPNPGYYKDILAKLGVQPEECLMVGNDVGEDMIAEALGMKVFLLTDCLINKHNVDISRYPQGGFDALNQYIDALVG